MRRALAAVLTSIVLLVGCGGATEPPAVGDGDGDGASSDSGGHVALVECGGSSYDPATLADAPGISSLPAGPADAVDDAGDPALEPSEDWRVVSESDDRVELVRELDEPVDHGGGDVRTHESRTLERITGATNVPDGTWMLTSAGPCTQRLATGDDLGEADIVLAEEPSPDDTTIELLVRERACASGRSAEGRIELVDLDEAADEVRLRIGVQRRPGDQTCPGNPPTPFTVELSGPLRDRSVVDASVLPARELTVDRVDGGS